MLLGTTQRRIYRVISIEFKIMGPSLQPTVGFVVGRLDHLHAETQQKAVEDWIAQISSSTA